METTLTQANPTTKSLSLKTTANKQAWPKYENVFVANSGGLDADNEMIPAGAWDLSRFEKNGPIFYQHRGYFETNPDLVLAKGEAFIDNDRLMLGITEWDAGNELAMEVKRKVDADLINTVSVGFMEKSPGEVKTVNDRPVYVYDNVELMEVSIVHIPSDPNAVKVKTTTGNMTNTQTQLTFEIDNPVTTGDDINPPQPPAKKSQFENQMIAKKKIEIELWLAQNKNPKNE